MNNDTINDITDRINNRTAAIRNAMVERNRQDVIIEQGKTQNAIDRANIENIPEATRAKNLILFVTNNDLLVIPFVIEQVNGMPFLITNLAILDDMSVADLRYYLAGYNLPIRGSKNRLRQSLAIFIGIPRRTAEALYAERPTRRRATAGRGTAGSGTTGRGRTGRGTSGRGRTGRGRTRRQN